MKWKCRSVTFGAGCVLGVLLGIGLTLGGIYEYGRRSNVSHENIFTGETWTVHRWGWKSWTERHLRQPHTFWAEKHITGKQMYYNYTTSSSWGRSGDRRWADMYAPGIVRQIYALKVPEAQRVKLLKEYQQALLKIVSVPSKQSNVSWHEMQWEAKLKEIPITKP